MTIKLTDEKRLKAKQKIKDTSRISVYSMEHFAKFIGTLTAYCPAVKYGWAHTKAFERAKYLSLKTRTRIRQRFEDMKFEYAYRTGSNIQTRAFFVYLIFKPCGHTRVRKRYYISFRKRRSIHPDRHFLVLLRQWDATQRQQVTQAFCVRIKPHSADTPCGQRANPTTSSMTLRVIFC